MHYPLSLTISVVTYFSELSKLTQLLQSLNEELKNLPESLSKVKLFLIDNSIDNSFDTSHLAPHEYRQELVKILSKNFDYPYEFIPSNKNLGFSKGHNLILKKILTGELDPDFHLVLNPDVIIAKNAIMTCIEFMHLKRDAGLITPNSTNRFGEKEYLCKRYPGLFVLLLRGLENAFLRRLFNKILSTYEMRDCIGDEVYCDVEIASGCFMFLRVDAIRDTGIFDERFFLYFEDFDYSLRLKKKWRICYHPDVKITHFGGFTGKKSMRHKIYFIESLIKFFNKHGWKIL